MLILLVLQNDLSSYVLICLAIQFCTVAAQEFDICQLTAANVRIHQINSTFIHLARLLVSTRVLKMQAYYSMMGAAEG